MFFEALTKQYYWISVLYKTLLSRQTSPSDASGWRFEWRPGVRCKFVRIQWFTKILDVLTRNFNNDHQLDFLLCYRNLSCKYILVFDSSSLTSAPICTKLMVNFSVKFLKMSDLLDVLLVIWCACRLLSLWCGWTPRIGFRPFSQVL